MDRLDRQSTTTEPPATGRLLRLAQRVFREFNGSFALRLWDGSSITIGAAAPAVTLIVRYPALVREMVLHRDPLRLAEAYFQDRVDVEGDLYATLALREDFQSLKLSLGERARYASRDTSGSEETSTAAKTAVPIIQAVKCPYLF